MEDENRQIRVLICIALLLAALLVGYNAFFVPDVPTASYFATDLSSQKDPESAASSAEKINLNTATQEELDTLEGIGPVMAERIVSYREENGPFYSIDELKDVDGIGEKTFEKLKLHITV